MKSIVFLLISSLLMSCGVKRDSGKKKGDGVKLPKTPIKTPITPIEAKNEKLLNWHQYDREADSLFGVSTIKTYQDFKLKQKRQIIVAVIDSGVDIQHEDLKEVIWVNKNEIPGNGKDDDGNGYIDDIHGWNFIGGADGKHIDAETLEVTRIYKKLLTKLQNGEVLSTDENKLFEEVKTTVEEELATYSKLLKDAKEDKALLAIKLATIQARLGLGELKTREDIEKIQTTESDLVKIKGELLELWDSYRGGFSGIDYVIEVAGYYATVGYNIDFNARAEIVGDNPGDFTDTKYGNNDVTGPDSSHGTHVSGSIAASRNNGIGMDGIAANVKIMVLRVVPNGDERDKDIALAVKYAADNGAHIINMSFGKTHSPYKEEVDKAFEYAASKGVLSFHAAGNSALNNDGGKTSYPNSYKLGAGVYKVDTIKNWVEIGASTKEFGLNLIASFSNYGKESVNLFSPGHKIYSTVPGSKYDSYSGTSMATPVAAGVAALLMSEFPTMTGEEAKAILMATVDKQTNLSVRKPDESANTPDFRLPVSFGSLSQTGGVINVYNAVKLAKELAEEK